MGERDPAASGVLQQSVSVLKQREVSRRNQLEVPKRLVRQVLEKNPGDPTALRLAGLIDRASQP